MTRAIFALVALPVISGCMDAEGLSFSSWESLDARQRIRTGQDVESVRAETIDFVFGAPLPSRFPDAIDPISDPAFAGYAIEQITVATDDLTSFAYLIHPQSWNGALAIYHQGHAGDFRTFGAATIRELLESNYQVMAFAMPMRGMNTHPFQRREHSLLESRDHALRYFADPVVIALNWAEETYAYTRRFMVGISGGGWTTVLVAGIDERIDASYPVAGSWPHYLRQIYGSIGDYEQQITPNYLELYLMATYPDRTQVQVFNEFDSCCFAGTVAYDYLAYVSYRADSWGGRFDILMDRGQKSHTLSEHTLSEILEIELPIAISLE